MFVRHLTPVLFGFPRSKLRYVVLLPHPRTPPAPMPSSFSSSSSFPSFSAAEKPHTSKVGGSLPGIRFVYPQIPVPTPQEDARHYYALHQWCVTVLNAFGAHKLRVGETFNPQIISDRIITITVMQPKFFNVQETEAADHVRMILHELAKQRIPAIMLNNKTIRIYPYPT